jgi:hypothetical protein
MEDYPLMRELWQIRSTLDRIEAKLAEPKKGLLEDKTFLLIAGIGVALLLPAEKQQAVMALLVK